MKKQLIQGIALGLLSLSVWNCKTSDPEALPYNSGVFIINSGNFFDNNGSISFLPHGANTTSTDIFNTVNARTLTGGVQDYTEIDGKGIILVDNSTAGQDKVEIVESGTFKSLATFKSPDVENPRYVAKAGLNKAYISCWDATGDPATNFYAKPGYILVVNTASRTVTKKIPVAKGAERIVVVGNEAFVGNVGGDQNLMVINTETDEVKQPGIVVGASVNPVAQDANGKLWAYTSSTVEMVRIDPTTKGIDVRYKVGSGGKTPGSIIPSDDKQSFYFVNSFYDPADNYKQKGETYAFNIKDGTTQLLVRRLFSGLGVDPQTKLLYAGVAPSLKQAGYALRYRISANTATLVDSVKAEINPTAFYFR
jgi:hypothetical protein